MKDHADTPTFRAWLVKQLTLTRWSASATTHPLALALRLGVRLDVLQEAIELRRKQMDRVGKAKAAGLLRRSDYATVSLAMPPSVHGDWQLFCRTLGLLPATVLRSVVQRFLLAPERPQSVGPCWVYRGAVQRMPRGTTNAKTRVTRGARIALNHHADEWGVSTEALVRGLVTDVLEGRQKRFRPVAFSELWGDSDRYLHPEKFK